MSTRRQNSYVNLNSKDDIANKINDHLEEKFADFGDKLGKKQTTNISSSQYQNITPQEDLRKAIMHNFSSNQFKTTFNNLNSQMNNTMENARDSPFLTNHYSNSAN